MKLVAAIIACVVLVGCARLESPLAARKLCDGSDPECVDTVSRPWPTAPTTNPPCDLVQVQTFVIEGYIYTFTWTAHYNICPTP